MTVKKPLIGTLILLVACASPPEERYGYVTTLGDDTIAVEAIARQGNRIESEAVDRFPRVRQRKTQIDLNDDGSIRRLVMDIHTPSEPAKEQTRKVVAEVGSDSVRVTKTDGTGEKRMSYASAGGIAMAHVPQMYSLYDLYFQAARRHATPSGRPGVDTARMRQFYIDREFDRFPLHRGFVRFLPGGKAEINHDWLSGIGEATLDSAGRMTAYSGRRTTYNVRVFRVSDLPDVKSIGERFASTEKTQGVQRALSLRDTVRAQIGDASFTVDYSRPLARGRKLLGELVPFDRVWRTGANAATQFTTSTAITLAGLRLPAGQYTLWTIPRQSGAELIVNRQTGQWGTGYNPANDLGRAGLTTAQNDNPVEKFTISIVATDASHGELSIEWGDFRWAAPIVIVP